MLWNLKVGVEVALDSVKQSIATIKWEFEKMGSDLEKTSWNKVFQNIKKWSQETLQTISWLNKKLEELRAKLDISAIWSKEFKNIQKEIQETQKKLDDATWKVRIFKKTLKWIWWIVAGLGIIEFWKNIITLWASYEQTNVAFTTMLWSWEKAKKMLADLWKFAKETPFEIQWLRETTKQLLAFWVSQEEMLPTLKNLWDVAAWLSVPVEQLAYAYWQVKVAWRLMGWELMQFTNAWVPLLSELAKMYETNEAAIKKMVEQWKIWFAEVEQAFKNMSSEGWRFEDLMQKQSETLAWKWNSLKDDLALVWEEIWKAILPALSEILNFFAAIVWAVSPYILGLIKVISISFSKVKVWFTSTANYVQKNWEKVLKFMSSIFLATMILWKKQALLNFLKWTSAYIILWLKNASLATKNFSKDIIWNTGQILKNTFAKIWNSTASLKQSVSNNVASFSFKNLWKSIFSATKNLLFLWLKFFAIAGIVLLVVTTIYKNWEKLKNKLKPIFEFIAKIWQKAPEFIAKAFNSLVDIVFWAFDMILSWTKKIAWWLNKLWLNIDTSWIDNLRESADNLRNSLKITWEDVTGVFNAIWWAIKWVASDFENAWWDVKNFAWWMDKLWWTMEETWKKAEKTWWKTAQANKKIEKSIKNVEKEYEKLKNKVEKLNNLEEKRKDDLLEFNRQIIDSNHDVKESLEDISLELEKNKKNIELWKQDKLAQRYVEIIEKEKELEEEILELKNKENDNEEKKEENLEKINKQIEIQKQRILEIDEKTKESTKQSLKAKLEELEKTKELLKSGEWSLENAKKMAQIEAERLKMAKEKELIKENIDSKERLDKALWEASLWKTAKILYDANEEKNKAQEEYEAEKKKLEDKLKINQMFEKLNSQDKKITQKDLNSWMESEEVKQMTLENQRYFRKLAEQKIEHSKQKDEILKLQNEIADETINIQNKVNDILKENIKDLSDEYKNLINQIKTAILEQSRLNSMRSSSSLLFSEGWYTWDWHKYEEAWIVHKWEYVIPQHMLKSIPNLMPSLEAIRTGQNLTTQNFNTNKSIDVWNITLQEKIDLELFFEKMKWKL